MYGSERLKIVCTLDVVVQDLLQSFTKSEGGIIDRMEAIYKATTLSVQTGKPKLRNHSQTTLNLYIPSIQMTLNESDFLCSWSKVSY